MKPKTITISGAVVGEPNGTYQIVEVPNTFTITAVSPQPDPNPWDQPATKVDVWVALVVILLWMTFLAVVFRPRD